MNKVCDFCGKKHKTEEKFEECREANRQSDRDLLEIKHMLFDLVAAKKARDKAREDGIEIMV